jgi:hypothetical protein
MEQWSYRELSIFREMRVEDREQRVAMIMDGADFERVEGIAPKPHPHFNGYIGTRDFAPHFGRRLSAVVEWPGLKAGRKVCGID